MALSSPIKLRTNEAQICKNLTTANFKPKFNGSYKEIAYTVLSLHCGHLCDSNMITPLFALSIESMEEFLNKLI